MTFSIFCPQLQRISLTTGVKMKSLLILLFVIAAVFADSHEQDVFEAGQTYLMLGSNNKFLSLINYGGDAGYNYIVSRMYFVVLLPALSIMERLPLHLWEPRSISSLVETLFNQLQVSLPLQHSLRWRWEILSLRCGGLEHTMSTLRLLMETTGVWCGQ